MHLSSGTRVRVNDLFLIASAFVAVAGALAVLWRARRAARSAFVHTVGDAARSAIVDELAPVKVSVEDLHVRLASHLTAETAEVAGIHTRVTLLEVDQKLILDRVGELADQVARDTAKVVYAIQTPPSEGTS